MHTRIVRPSARSQQKEGAVQTEAAPRAPGVSTVLSHKQEGASTDLAVILPRLKKVTAQSQSCAMPSAAVASCSGNVSSLPARLLPQPRPQLALPYWTDAEEGSSARWRLAAVLALTLGTTGVR
jgi:hypothetical protein